MNRYLIKIAYDGSKFYGFQRLNDFPTVQSEIEKALKIITKNDILIKGAGRTDKGVHALGQCAHFETKMKIEPEKLAKAMQRYISKNIKVIWCKKVTENFHARFSVKEKTYCYKINIGEYSPLLNDYYFQPHYKVRIKKLKKAAKLFVGKHDFKNFVSGNHENTLGTIFKVNVYARDKIIYLEFKGKAFYRYMVRNLVGAMLDYDKDKVSLKDIKEMLDNPLKKRQLSTAQECGLYLVDIKY